ncbi:MAG: hypothetical protein QM773_09325 [Hyphomonadaceae bacterium]
MEERLPSQIYVVGNFLLLLVLVLALLMMPRAMALDPREFGSLTPEEQFEQAAGLQPLGATGLPELRILSASETAASGVVVTPAAIERYDLSGGSSRRFKVTHREREATPVAAQAIRQLRKLAAYDSLYMICGSGGGNVSITGYVDGREFSFRETGDCTGGRSPAVDALFKLIAPKD